MIYWDIVQRSEEWHKMRLGCLGGSKLGEIMKGKRGTYLASRQKLQEKLLAEILTGQTKPFYPTEEMQWGIDNEPLAKGAYEAKIGCFIDDAGIIVSEVHDRFRISPDGLIDDDGCVEVKCPDTTTHLDTLLHGTIKDIYMIQMQGLMLIDNRAWCDFISYDPRMPNEKSLYIKRIYRNEPKIKEIEEEVGLFLGEIETLLAEMSEF